MLKFEKNWADEFYWTEVYVMNEEIYKEYKSLLKKYKDYEIDYWFGTNEGWENELIVDLDDDVSIYEIDSYTYEALLEVFPLGYPNFFEYIDEDEDEESVI